jgi:retinol-binding protein 3
MLRRLLLALAFTVATLPATLPAQKTSDAAIPSNPAGQVLKAWLDAFNSGDSARLAAYYKRYLPDVNIGREMSFRRQIGGFDLVSVHHSDAEQIQFSVKERNSPNVAFGVIEMPKAGSTVLQAFRLGLMGPNAKVTTVRVDAAQRKSAIQGAIAKLHEYYVFPDIAKKAEDSLTARLQRGAYYNETLGTRFASRINRELGEIAHDKHMRFDFMPNVPGPEPEGPPPDRKPDTTQLSAERCAFEKAEILAGNVGYLKFNGFAPVENCGKAASTAMNKLADADALIIDLRTNGGGSPEMVAHISSYLFSTRTHLNDLWERKGNKTTEYWTRDVPGPRFGGEKPVYVLTSSNTFSAAEEFTYNLKNLKRATIVGETTGGGAHPVSGHRIADHFMIGVPFARAINPISKTNWEGTGVTPDVKVPATDALKKAQQLIQELPRRKTG